MSSPNFLSSSPFTLQSNIAGTSSIAALFTTMSDNDTDLPPSPTFTGLSNPGGSAGASLESKLSLGRTTLTTSTTAGANSNANSNSPSSGVSATAATATATSPPNASGSGSGSGTGSGSGSGSGTGSGSGAGASSTLAQSYTGTSTPLSEKTTGADGSGSGTGTNNGGASTTTTAANDSTPVAKSSVAGGMSTGTKAAIAVPIVIIALALLILAILFIRRRKKKRQEKGLAAEKVPLAAQKKKWTRHLRIFSFDTELLMGGRFSSTNSVRSRQTGSMRSGASSQNSQTPSVHTVDEVAPPYRDAVSTAQPLSIGQVMAGAAAVGVGRSASNATAGTAGTMGTAPPPYGAGASRSQTPGTPSTLGRRNPFADSAPVSPVESSPFNDPVGQSPAMSRNSSLYHTERDDTSTLGGVSEAASIREATLARNASVMSGGRVINNVNRS